MNYEDRKYMICMFFGSLDFKALNFLVDFMSHVDETIPSLGLFQKEILNYGDLNIKTLRRSTYSGKKSLCAVESKSKGAKEVGIFIYDSDYSATVSPEILVNCHISSTGSFVNRKIMPANKDSLGCFLAIAISKKNEAIIGKRTLDNAIEQLFLEVGGDKGWYWEDSKYVYDDGRSVEWAYRNIPAKLEDGALRNWKEKTAKELVF